MLSFLVALFLAWHLLARADFFYATWYEVLDIDQTVATYGPRNRYRHGFANTDKREHQRLFAAIVTAIHDDGAGLEELQYFDTDSGVSSSFLTEAEIVHLRDVAMLINKVNAAGAAAVVVVLVLVAVIVVRRLPSPSLMRSHVGAAAVLAAAAALALNLGTEDVFYAMHEWVFPPDHQWFFYYQDSLMSTFMQAPNLFGYIALALAALAVTLYTAWIAGLIYFLRRTDRDPRGERRG
ncbi:MAG: DUF1461 domain-containing protein [Gammaproteobacteria bacterium]|nr:DUF1461 domain-containing protein [Gammaproteobacteria bacterium]